MAVSGDISFNLDRDAVIKEALQHLGELGAGESPSADDLTDCGQTLNIMLKSWPGRGHQMYLLQTIYLFLQQDTREYDIGLSNSNSDECTTSFWATTLDGAHSDTATSITVADGSNSTNSDRIGIKMDDGTMHWTTISSGGGTESLTIASGIDDDASDGAVVYGYTTKATRPERILEAYVKTKPDETTDGLHNAIDGIETPIDLLSRSDYGSLSIKTAEGRPSQVWWEPTWKTGTLHVWPEPDDVSDYLVLQCERTANDLDAATDDFDVPQRWYGALTWELAKWLLAKYGASDRTVKIVKEMAAETLLIAESSDTEEYIQFQPDYRGGRGGY